MNWNNGFSARYYITIVDPASWRDTETFDIVSGTVSKTTDNLMESADVVVTDLPANGEVWIRIWLDARQGASGDHVPIFTGLFQAPVTQWDGYRDKYNGACYSVLKPADDILLPRGWYALAGLNGAELAAQLLEGIAPVSYAKNAPALQTTIIAEDSETRLSMAQRIMKAIGWRIRIDGYGNIAIVPQADKPSVRFDPEENDVVEKSITDERDWYACPNVFRATSGDQTATARDDSRTSPLSTVSRGREIWKEDGSAVLGDGEGIAEYAMRRLAEEQAPARKIKYARRFQPDIVPGDMVSLHYMAQNIDGNFKITRQQITLGFGARTQEEVENDSNE